MTISQSDKNHFIPKRVLVLIGIFLIFVFIITSFHYHVDGEKQKKCLICILIQNLSHCFISNPQTLVLPAISYVFIVFYLSLCPCVALPSYHSRASPFYSATINPFYNWIEISRTRKKRIKTDVWGAPFFNTHHSFWNFCFSHWNRYWFFSNLFCQCRWRFDGDIQIL